MLAIAAAPVIRYSETGLKYPGEHSFCAQSISQERADAFPYLQSIVDFS
ncbi:MAG: hypothetical protein ACYCOR_02725 [Acidobacteriaceae bacterium]